MSGKKVLQFVGINLEAVVSKNGAKGEVWKQNMIKLPGQVTKRHPNVNAVKLSGAVAHTSHSDPSETQQIISAQFGVVDATNKFKRLESGHIREDGTIKWSKLDQGQSSKPAWLTCQKVVKDTTGKETIKDDKGAVHTVHNDPKDAKRKYVTIGKQTYYF